MVAPSKGSSGPHLNSANRSSLQLKLPVNVHWDFREALYKHHLTVADVAEDMVLVYMAYMEHPDYVVPDPPVSASRQRKLVHPSKEGPGTGSAFYGVRSGDVASDNVESELEHVS